MAFDNSTDEHAISQAFEWPAEYTGNDVKAIIWFYSTTDGSGSNREVVFNIALNEWVGVPAFISMLLRALEALI